MRAIDAVDTPARRGELARALGYWAARYSAGQPAGPQDPVGDPRAAVVRAAAAAALAQVHAEHAALYAGIHPVDEARPAGAPEGELVPAAVRSLDPHQVKLVEACRRGLAGTGDPAFAAAAETVTGLR